MAHSTDLFNQKQEAANKAAENINNTPQISNHSSKSVNLRVSLAELPSLCSALEFCCGDFGFLVLGLSCVLLLQGTCKLNLSTPF